MPGPGGGHGGGFHGGGGGGGFHGGGGGGGFHGGPHYHHHYYGWGWGPRWYGGGFFGGLMSILFAPLILLGMAVIFFFVFVFGAVSAVGAGGVVAYDYDRHADYMDGCYAEAFDPSSGSYEQNLVISFLVSDEYGDYYVATWAGNYLQNDIDGMLACSDSDGYTSVIERACLDYISDSSFKGSVVYEISEVVDALTEQITALGLDSSFTRNPEYKADPAASKVKNTTEATNDPALLEAVQNFTRQTGIGLVVTVDTMADVLGTDYTSMIVGIVIIVVLVALAVFLLVRGIMSYRKRKNRDDDGGYVPPRGGVHSDF